MVNGPRSLLNRAQKACWGACRVSVAILNEVLQRPRMATLELSEG